MLSNIRVPNSGSQGGAAGSGAGGAAGTKALSKGGSGMQPGGHKGVRTLRKGMSGMDVARCQNLLNRELAYAPPPLWVDGIFGPKTDRKVREFQTKKRLEVDGIVGPNTWSALEGRPVASGGGYGGGSAGKGKGTGKGGGFDIMQGWPSKW